MKNETKKLAYIEGIGSIVINVILFILKYWVGIMTGSIAIIADAWHTLSDSLTSVVVILGAKISSKPADENHPFGHGRAESIASIIIGVLLFIVGSNFLFEAIQRLRSKEAAVFTMSAVIIFILSVIIKEAMAQFSFWAYRKTKSYSLKADGWHHRSDSIASAIILLSIFLGKDLWWIDGVFGIIVSVLIIYTAFDILKEASQPILGKNPDQASVEQIRKVAKGYNLNGIHDIKEHCYGSHLEYTMHVYMQKNTQIHGAHYVIKKFKEDLRAKLKIEATVFIEPE
ncbi:MAG: cation transporter [Deltaproteobacteria bacterium]|uniref:cation diffusion facilitator family transporter n=1 Tax=Desulfobacula sp. TaxID=2593537 RepID=UPI00199E1D8F|nr:cation transporter [Candidatus Desulfobacula maris]MBL6993300.1 cation transporter [Desulfobacula sp.]